jgi:hypothetical protein
MTGGTWPTSVLASRNIYMTYEFFGAQSLPNLLVHPPENPDARRKYACQRGGLQNQLVEKRQQQTSQQPAIGIGGSHYGCAPATPPGMRVRTGRFEKLRL